MQPFCKARMLNLGKGPAVHSLRVQTDRKRYHEYMKHFLEKCDNLELKQAEITGISVENGKVTGVQTNLGGFYAAKAVVVATGTYLGGRIFVGEAGFASGPDGQHAANQLTQSLQEIGIPLRRFKTGTPARVHRRSVDFSKLEVQPGDAEIVPFSFLTEGELKNKVECHIAFTNPRTHEVIQNNLHRFSTVWWGRLKELAPAIAPLLKIRLSVLQKRNATRFLWNLADWTPKKCICKV